MGNEHPRHPLHHWVHKVIQEKKRAQALLDVLKELQGRNFITAELGKLIDATVSNAQGDPK